MNMLKDIQQILEKEKFDCSFQEADENLPLDRLKVLLGTDYQKREQFLEIVTLEQTFPQPSAGKYYQIQFSFVFPFKIEENALTQVASLILFLNHTMEFPGLELNELNNRVLYRYVWLTNDQGIDGPLIVGLMGIIMLVLELFTQTIEHLALGQSTFNELLEEVLKIGKTPN